MDEIIELAIATTAGTIDCRLEPIRTETELFYSTTILYPNTVTGFSRSEIFCLDLRYNTDTGSYYFETEGDDIHPKIKELEARISEAIKNAP